MKSHQQNESIQIKLQKIKLFISQSDQDLPVLTNGLLKTNKIGPMLRMYFNDDDFIIKMNDKQKINYFQDKISVERIQKCFEQYVQQIKNNKQISQQHKEDNVMSYDFLQFIQFFVNNERNIQVNYDAYDNLINKQVIQYQQYIIKIVSKKVAKQQKLNPSKQKNNQQSQQTPPDIHLKIAISHNQNNDSRIRNNKSTRSVYSHKSQANQQIKNSFRYYLRKFYQHYCKKFVNSIKDKDFGVIQQFYNSMNLNKFMMYCKDIGVIKIQKKVTVKFLTEKFKSNQNKEHSLTFDAFQKVIKEILEIAYKTKEQLQTKGYGKIGVKDRPNFVQKMSKIGVIVPLKKVVFKKASNKKSQQKVIAKQQQLSNSKLFKQSSSANINKYIKNGGYSHGYDSNWNSDKLHKQIFLNEKQRKQQILLQSLSIPKLNKLKPSQKIQQKLQQLIDDQDDPYLKRYNDKNSSQYNNIQNNSGMIKRIDERIQNVVKRIR